MTAWDLLNARSLVVGGLTRDELLALLRSAGVLLNAHAETLVADSTFDDSGSPDVIHLVECSVGDLGLPEGATLSQIYDRAQSRGLHLCPPMTAPYLRLALRSQASASDTGLSSGRAPSGSLTVAAPAFRDDDEYPKGFYLRVIAGQQWLRGYRCDDQHLWSPQDRFVFRAVG